MSTTVSYKGNTIATLSNETKTLTTAGTWVEGDITITDVMSGVDVPIFTITWDSNWSTIISITCSKTFSECYNRGQQEEKYDAILISTDGTDVYVYENGGNYNLKYNPETYRDYILLTIADNNGYPYAELIYNSDGTFEYNDGTRIGQTLNVSTNGTYTPSWGQMYNNVVVNVPSSSPSLQTKTNINPTTSSQTITADSGYDGLSSVQINAMPTGTAGTPSASKGTVSNHSVSVTPSVTNTTGYITGGTKTGTAVTVTASELASGNKEITSNGTNIDVVGYSTVSVDVQPDDFIVTLSYNSTTEMWEPDCTYSSILAAYNNNKNIIFYIGTSDGYADGYIHPVRLNVLYRVYEDYYDYTTESGGAKAKLYTYNSNGLTNEYDDIIYYTDDADTVASSVPSGNIFYNSTGRVVGTAPIRSSTDLTASGATVTAPAGFYSSAATKTISSGTATPASSISATGATLTAGTNTLTLSKTVSNTPQVSAGYVSSGTAGNSSVSLTASVSTRTSSDLTVSGATVTVPAGYYSAVASKSVSSMTLPTSAAASATSGFTSKATISRSTSDQYINIPVGYNASGAYYKINAVANGTEGTPTATKGAVSNHSISVTPSVTNTAGYITGGTKTGTAVTVTASELASGNKAIVDNGTGIDVVGYSTVSVAVPFSTITVSSSNPSGGSNGDVWIKTS